MKNSSMIKAIFFDLDGTLIPSATGTCSPAVKNALDVLRSKKILLFAATGRSPYELNVTKMIDGLIFDAIVSMNGQFCYTATQTIRCRAFDRHVLAPLLRQIETAAYPCEVIGTNSVFISSVDSHVRAAQASVRMPVPQLGDLSSALQSDVLMLTVFVPKAEDLTFRKALKHACVSRWNEYAIDVLPEGGGKCAGVEAVLQKFNLQWSDVMAFGDGESDYEMLQKAKLGVAMGHSAEVLRDCRFYQTDDADHDGVISALQHFQILW
jgi:Cof subfamily protein (haloacid dehalogenase superfamily)